MSNKYSSSRTSWLRYSALLLVAFLFSQGVWAQVSAYSFSASSGTYTPLVGGTGSGIAATADGAASGNLPIGFSFVYNNTAYTQFRVGSDGILVFGTAGTNSLSNDLATTTTSLRPGLAPLWDDLQCTVGVTYQLSGTSPNQVLTVEWANMEWNYAGTAAISFQVKLYETTNVIEFIYQQEAGAVNAGSASIGIMGTSTADYISLQNTSATPTTSTTASTNILNTKPATGQVYTFTPPAACVSVTAQGTTTTTNAAPCAGVSFTLNVTGATTDSPAGITYQWWSSPDNTTYSPISGATAASLTTSTLTGTVWYYRETICAAGPSNAFSDPVEVNGAAPLTAPTAVEPFATFTPACWREATGALTASSTLTYGSGEWAAGDFANVPGNTGFRVNLYSSGNDWVVSPAIDLGAGGKALQYSYAVTTYLGTGSVASLGTHVVNVVVSTDAGATWSNANIVKSYTGAGTYSNTGATETVILTGYTGVVMIGFHESTTSTSPDIDFHVDNFQVIDAPSCPDPSAGVASALTGNSANLGWTENGTATTWNVEYGASGFTLGTGTLVSGTTSNPLPVSSLTPQTAYQFYVQADCGGSQSNWAGPYNFTTPCLAYTTPYLESFSATLDACASTALWAPVTADATHGASAPYSGSHFARMDVYNVFTSSNPVNLTMPTVSIPDANQELRYFYWLGASGNTASPLAIAISANGGAFTTVYTHALSGTPNSVSNTWTENVINLAAYAGQDIQVRFIGTSNYGSGFCNMGVDEVSIAEPPACLAPSALTASNFTTASADLGWTENGTATAWNVEYGATGFTQGTGTVVAAGSNPYTLGGLSAATTYQYYVQADCGLDQSVWVGPFSFTTACNAETVPWTEGFEGLSSFGAGVVPTCQRVQAITSTAMTSANAAVRNGVGARTGTNYLWARYSTTSVYYTPAITLTNGQSYDFSFWNRETDGSAGFTVTAYVGTVDDYTTMTSLGNAASPAATSYTENRFSYVAPADGDYYFAIYVTGTGAPWYQVIDDIAVEDTPACPAPSSLTAVNITATGAEFDWTAGGSESLWNIEVGPAGFTQGTGVVISDIFSLPYPVTGVFSANTSYDYYVQANCGGSTSAWAGPYTFTTSPGCGSAWQDPGGSGNYSNNTNETTTICPDTPGDVVTVAFTSFSLENGWDFLDIYEGSSTSGTLIGSYTGLAGPGVITSTDPSGCLTFVFTSDGFGTDAGWDATISCGPPPTCGTPNVSGINPSFDSVSFTINASSTGTPSGYEYEIVLDGATPTGTGVASASNVITSSNTLTAATAYDLYVRTDCGVADGFSDWAGPFSFTTANTPPANYNCANAIQISCGDALVSGTTVNALLDFNYIDAGAGGTAPQRGVWYYIAGDDNQYTIDMCDATGFDSRISVYSGSCGALVPVTGNDDMGASCSISTTRSEVVFNAFAGTDYYVYVHSYSTFTQAAFNLNVACAAICFPPANDACAAAETLDQNTTCINTTGSTTCSTSTLGLSNPSGVSTFATYNDVWYSFTALYNDYYLTFSNITATNLLYSIFVGADCASLNATGVNGFTATDGFQQGLFGATVGETYWVRVGIAPGTGTDGTFDLCLVGIPCSTPVNSAVTTTSQTNVNVVIGGTEGEAYIIEYGPTGFTPGTDGTAGAGGTIVNTSTLTNNVTVAAESTYDFYIRKDCSGSAEGYSFNEGPFAVSTYLIVPYSGNNSITSCGETIYDHAGPDADYAAFADGYLVVYPSANSVLVFNGTYAGIETCCDDLYIYEGAGIGGTLLGNFNGTGSFTLQASAPNVPMTIRFTSDVSAQGAGFEITTSCLAACAGVPSVGVLQGPATACNGVPFTMSVANPLDGYAYQWQRITSAGWTNIPGANSSSYTATQTAPTTYRCRVNCTYSSNYLGISAPKSVGMSDPSTCYCTPEYTFGTTDGDYIDAVSFGSINNVTGANTSAPYYTEYGISPFTTTSIAQGGEYSGSIDVATDWGGLYASVWIDYNRNGIFEASERAFNSGSIDDPANVPFDLVVPANASLGNTRMRVRLTFSQSNQDACSDYGYGETEDYTVTIVAGSANDAQANATAVNPAPYPACVNYSANLANATPSTGGGNDVWYQFVASSNAARIAVTSSFDVSIEVWDSSDAPVDAVEDATTAGNETFITGGLTAGDTYYVLVRDESGAPSTCNVCIQALNPSTCDNGPNFASLCNTFKADWTGTASYNFTFTNQSTLSVHTASTTSNTQILLASVAGLEYGASYDVSIDAVYNLANAAGTVEQVIANSTSSCPITIAPAPAVNLRAIDRDPATRSIGAFIGTDVSVCAVVSWDWSFELVDDFGDPLSLDPPAIVNTGSSSRYIRTSSIPGVAAGNRYRVMVRPVFAYGAGSFDTGSFYYLRIAGGAGMVENGGNEATPNNFVVGEGSGASAAIYPNPSNGEMVNLNLAGINSDNVMVRIMDASGRLVWSNRYVVDGSLNTIVSFDRPLASGLYIVEMNFDGQVLTERMMVQK